MEKEIIIISDLEMGAGTLTDDFISDNAFAGLMRSISNKKHPVDLVFNGDTFDFIRCPFMVGGRDTYPRHICNEVAVAKLDLVYKAHPKVFQSLHDFVLFKKNRIFFVIGNHDPDLVFPEVQKALKNLIGGHKENIIFPGFECEINGVYIEHGHRYDFFFESDFNHSFSIYKNKKILNLPATTIYLITSLIGMKKTYPFCDRIFPRPMTLNKELTIVVTLRTILCILKGLFHDSVHYNDPTNITIATIKRFIKLLFKSGLYEMWNMEPITDIYAKNLSQKPKTGRLSVLAHEHDMKIKKEGDHTILQTGAWRDGYALDKKSRLMIPKPKNYISVKVSGHETDFEMIDFPIKRSLINYDEAMKDEVKFLYRVAKEEGYPLSL